MSKSKLTPVNELSCEEFDEIHHPRPMETDFGRLVEREISRRGFLGAGITFGAAAFVANCGVYLPRSAFASSDRFGFEAIPTNTLDTVTVAPGYNWHVVAKWGEPLWSNGVEFDHVTRGTGASQELAFGDNNDGMCALHPRGSPDRPGGQQRVYVNRKIIYGGAGEREPRRTPTTCARARPRHGVSVVEIAETALVKLVDRQGLPLQPPHHRGHPHGDHRAGAWPRFAQDGSRPEGHVQPAWHVEQLRQRSHTLGHLPGLRGRTSTGTSPRAIPTLRNRSCVEALRHRGRRTGDTLGRRRTSASTSQSTPTEPNRNGLRGRDRSRGTRTQPRRSAPPSGRFKHENAEVVLAANGQVVVYMGDDERGEFLYRFVSDGSVRRGRRQRRPARVRAALRRPSSPKTVVAANGSNSRPESSGIPSVAEICIHTRAWRRLPLARRPWTVPSGWRRTPMKVRGLLLPHQQQEPRQEAERGRRPDTCRRAESRVRGNLYGQIVRWRPDGGDHLATGFDWDLYVVAGNPTVHVRRRTRGSTEPHRGQHVQFAGRARLRQQRRDALDPDRRQLLEREGLRRVRATTRCWWVIPETGEDPPASWWAPRQCEVTGFAWSADRKTLFVGIQHPGERGDSHFPDGGDTAPRSAIVAISRDDGGIVG